MKYGRVENGTVAEYRDFAEGEIPVHKSFLWLPVEDNPPEYDEFYEPQSGPILEIQSDKLLFAYNVVPKNIATLQSLIKKEAEKRITTLYPLWKQSNMLSDKITLLNKTRTPEEDQQLADIEQAFAFISDIREKSNAIEAMDPIPKNYTSDDYWT